jgi:hypothetical protein
LVKANGGTLRLASTQTGVAELSEGSVWSIKNASLALIKKLRVRMRSFSLRRKNASQAGDD